MCVKQFSFCAVLFFLLAVNLHSEQWYRVSETELSKLEAISQSWETDRQSWQSQASGLNGKVQSLQSESKSLNGQLAQERQTTKSLQKSFEQSEAEQLKRASDYETEIAALKEKKARSDIAVEKVKNERNILFFILAAVAGTTVFYLSLKAKTFFLH